ncbi:hypothetical protein [Streptomyces sp. NPDC059460]|uniref:hypothetical protein n=1 Tax=Streptomyces sp. NPDC059460 TaxID=3346840 RepID=UPI00369E8355
MNIQPLFEALDVQEDAARAMTDGLRTQIDELQARLREAETHLEHLAITRKTVTAPADRIPALRARDVCEALDHELLPKNVEGIRAKLKRLVKLDIITEDDAGSFAWKQ